MNMAAKQQESQNMQEAAIAQVRQHLAQLLGSQSFIQADRLRRFLQYLVEHALSGATESLNQFSIAFEVFDRDASFDPTVDAIVRVEAGRLRSKLLEYYDDEGRDAPVRIAFPKRGYAVRFEFQPASSAEPEPQAAPAVEPGGVSNPVIAVLPFANRSTDPEQEYFSDGITEDLITDLSQLPGLTVIARQSTFAYKGSAADAQQVSRELGADFIVEGSVRKVGQRIRINVQLLHGDSGQNIWAERFDREIDDIFALQDSVNRKIVVALKLQLTTAKRARLAHQGTEVIEAHDYVLRGMKETQALTREGSERARYCFESALQLDPNYATAYGRLSANAVYPWIVGWSTSRPETIDRGVELAQKAVALDGDNAYANATLCWALLWQERHDDAIAAGEMAISIDPNDVEALEHLAFALAWSNRGEEALKHLAKAQMLNPLHGYHFPSGVAYFMLGSYTPAVDALQNSIDANPRFLPAYLYLAASLSLLGRDDCARPVVATIKTLNPDYRPTDIRHPIFKYPEDSKRFTGAIARVL
jgi:TolB-like protein